MDNALIAFECLHAIENGNRECKEFDALKLDLTKTYDRVQWEYLEEVMKRLGFHRKWVQWIMSCVSSVRYSVYFNNMPLDFFTPRGLRQGGFFLWLIAYLSLYMIMCPSETSRNYIFVAEAQGCPISSLLMIPCCLLKQLRIKQIG
jgi:hypothetical protein